MPSFKSELARLERKVCAPFFFPSVLIPFSSKSFRNS